MLGEAVHRKFHHAAIGSGERLFHQVYLHRGIRIGIHSREQGGMHVRRNYNRQQRVLERVLAEDIREGSTQHGAESELSERPGSVFARAAAAEVIARQQDLRACYSGLVENEIGLWIALRVIAPIVKQLLVKAQFRRSLQEARGNNLIGIDIINRERNHAAFEVSEGLHRMVLTSVITPVMALAAAVSGLARNVRPPLP